MSFQSIGVPARYVKLFQKKIEQKRLGHAYCLYGSLGSDKGKFALEIAKAIYCTKQVLDACDNCNSCKQIDNGTHADVFQIQPEGQTIKIDQIRQLMHSFSCRPLCELPRVVIMHRAEKMTIQAANSLLKFLEEPLSPLLAVLETEYKDELLPTILSRCQLLYFPDSSVQNIIEILINRGYSADEAKLCAQLANGQMERVLDKGEIVLLVRQVIEWSHKIFSGQLSALLVLDEAWMRNWSERDCSFILDVLLFWLRDLLFCQMNLDHNSYIVGFGQKEAREQASQWSKDRLIKGMEAILAAQRRLAGPAQHTSVLEQMVLTMQEGSEHVKSDWCAL